MPVGQLVQPPTITVNGTAAADAVYDQLIELRVEQTVSVPSRLTMRFVDRDFSLIDGTTFGIGDEVTVSFPDHTGTETTVFTGEVVGIGADQSLDRVDGSELVITADDLAHRLGHTTNVKSFQKQSYGDAIASIAGAAGLTSQIDQSAKTVKHDYLLQTTSDYAFLNQIAFRLGHEWRIEAKKLVFGPRASSMPITLKYGEDLRRIKVRFTATDRTTEVTVKTWDTMNKQAIVGVSSATSNPPSVESTFPSPATSLRGNGRTKSKSFGGKRTATTLPASSTAEAGQLASALNTRIAASDLTARCEALGRPEIAVGRVVKITNAGTKLSGEYYVTSVEHVFGRNTDLVTRFATGGIEPTSIVDLLGGASRVDDFARHGLCVGVVTNNKDPDKIGRVRVKFPALSDEVESNWARVVSVGAGADTGILALPQVDDEVLVGFEHGDARRPYVLGGLWNAKSKPPADDTTLLKTSKVVQWNLHAAKHSMVLRGADADNEKYYKVVLSDGKTTFYLGADKIELIANTNKPIEIKSGQASIVLNPSGDVLIKGKNVTIEATQNLTLKGLQVEAKAQTSAKLEGGTALELKGGASAKLEASGVTEVKGAMVKVN